MQEADPSSRLRKVSTSSKRVITCKDDIKGEVERQLQILNSSVPTDSLRLTLPEGYYREIIVYNKLNGKYFKNGEMPMKKKPG